MGGVYASEWLARWNRRQPRTTMRFKEVQILCVEVYCDVNDILDTLLLN